MNIKIPIAITVGVIVIALAIGAGIWMANKSGDQVVQKACTMEARVCPDGSAVARTGPNCEFEACPENKDKNIVGNDRDEHGCIGSAGYSRCEEKKKCLRSWEESCSGATIYDSSKEEIYQNGESYFKITVPNGYDAQFVDMGTFYEIRKNNDMSIPITCILPTTATSP